MLTEFDQKPVDPKRAFELGVGAASPLWPGFLVAASAGVAFWWWSQWTRGGMLNEAQLGALSLLKRPAPGPQAETILIDPVSEGPVMVGDAAPPLAEAVSLAETMVESAVETEAAMIEAAVEAEAALVETAVEAFSPPVVEPVAEPPVETLIPPPPPEPPPVLKAAPAPAPKITTPTPPKPAVKRAKTAIKLDAPMAKPAAPAAATAPPPAKTPAAAEARPAKVQAAKVEPVMAAPAPKPASKPAKGKAKAKR